MKTIRNFEDYPFFLDYLGVGASIAVTCTVSLPIPSLDLSRAVREG